MVPSELLGIVVDSLDRFKVPYYITGSVASIAYGEPRMTHDVDIVAKLKFEHIEPLYRCFPEEEYYVSPDAIRDAIIHKAQFNIIHGASGFKADIMIDKGTPFDKIQFERRRIIRPEGLGRECMFGSPEDVILNKLIFHKMGGSPKHLRDITGVIKTQGERLDHQYIEEWANRLEVMSFWQACVERVTQTEE